MTERRIRAMVVDDSAVVRQVVGQILSADPGIGRIDTEAGLRLVDPQGRPVQRQLASFDHFA